MLHTVSYQKPKIIFSYSPNFGRPIRYIIIHGSGMNSDKEVLERLCSPDSKVSCHYMICQDGTIHQLVDDREIAWHAGVSKWKKDKSLNFTSLGIELFNSSAGNRSPYKKEQYCALLELLKYLISTYSIPLDNILGHSDIAPDRKSDPGVYFDWYRVKNELNMWNEGFSRQK